METICMKWKPFFWQKFKKISDIFLSFSPSIYALWQFIQIVFSRNNLHEMPKSNFREEITQIISKYRLLNFLPSMLNSNSFILTDLWRYQCKLQIRMRRLITSHLVRIYTVRHYWFLTETPICNNGCVQIQRWKSPYQKFKGERVIYSPFSQVMGRVLALGYTWCRMWYCHFENGLGSRFITFIWSRFFCFFCFFFILLLLFVILY